MIAMALPSFTLHRSCSYSGLASRNAGAFALSWSDQRRGIRVGSAREKGAGGVVVASLKSMDQLGEAEVRVDSAQLPLREIPGM